MIHIVKLKPELVCLVPNETEMAEQKAVIEWRDVMIFSGEIPELEWLIWIPNGLPDQRMASLIKKMGHKKGLPDFFFPVRDKGHEHPGLWIELKRIKGGRMSKDQMETMRELDEMGYAVAVAYGRQAAKETILSYLGRYKL